MKSLIVKLSTMLLLAVSAFGDQSTPNSVCSSILDFCTKDIQVKALNSTFGFLLPPSKPGSTSGYEDDFILKSILPLSYGSAGLRENIDTTTITEPTPQNDALLINKWFGFNFKTPTPSGTSLVSSTIHGQLSINSTTPKGVSSFELIPASQLPNNSSCRLQMSPFYLYTKTQITAYARVQGCRFIRRTSDGPATVSFFKTDAAPQYTDATNRTAVFPLDDKFKSSSAMIKDVDALRVSLEEYMNALGELSI